MNFRLLTLLAVAFVVFSTTGSAQQASPPNATPGKGAVQGLIRWNEKPIAEVTVEFCSDWRASGCTSTAYTAVTDKDGRYNITDIPSGKYVLFTQLPGERKVSWLNGSIQIESGQSSTEITVDVVKHDARLVSPVDRSKLSTSMPVLTWQAYPGAAFYEVAVTREAGYKQICLDRASTTEYTIAAPLEPGRYYWGIYVYRALESRIAESDLGYFTVGQ